MSGRKDGGSAFPGEYVVRNGMHSTRKVAPKGMTLRDYFAGQALAGMLAWDGYAAPISEAKTTAEIFAHSAYELADAMLAERDQ